VSIKPEALPGKKAAGGSGKGGLSAWVKTHQKQAAFGAAGLGVVAIALFKKKSAASTAASSSSAIDPATGVPYATELATAQQTAATTGDAGYYGSSSGGYGADGGSGYGDQLGTDITGLDTQLAALSAQIGSNNPAPAVITPTTASGVTPVDPNLAQDEAANAANAASQLAEGEQANAANAASQLQEGEAANAANAASQLAVAQAANAAAIGPSTAPGTAAGRGLAVGLRKAL
jgi:hypothetical protein